MNTQYEHYILLAEDCIAKKQYTLAERYALLAQSVEHEPDHMLMNKYGIWESVEDHF